MADRYLLESGAPDGYLLEDGSGVLIIDQQLPAEAVVNPSVKETTRYTDPPFYHELSRTKAAAAAVLVLLVSAVAIQGVSKLHDSRDKFVSPEFEFLKPRTPGVLLPVFYPPPVSGIQTRTLYDSVTVAIEAPARNKASQIVLVPPAVGYDATNDIVLRDRRSKEVFPVADHIQAQKPGGLSPMFYPPPIAGIQALSESVFISIEPEFTPGRKAPQIVLVPPTGYNSAPDIILAKSSRPVFEEVQTFAPAMSESPLLRDSFYRPELDTYLRDRRSEYLNKDADIYPAMWPKTALNPALYPYVPALDTVLPDNRDKTVDPTFVDLSAQKFPITKGMFYPFVPGVHVAALADNRDKYVDPAFQHAPALASGVLNPMFYPYVPALDYGQLVDHRSKDVDPRFVDLKAQTAALVTNLTQYGVYNASGDHLLRDRRAKDVYPLESGPARAVQLISVLTAYDPATYNKVLRGADKSIWPTPEFITAQVPEPRVVTDAFFKPELNAFLLNRQNKDVDPTFVHLQAQKVSIVPNLTSYYVGFVQDKPIQQAQDTSYFPIADHLVALSLSPIIRDSFYKPQLDVVLNDPRSKETFPLDFGPGRKVNLTVVVTPFVPPYDVANDIVLRDRRSEDLNKDADQLVARSFPITNAVFYPYVAARDIILVDHRSKAVFVGEAGPARTINLLMIDRRPLADVAADIVLPLHQHRGVFPDAEYLKWAKADRVVSDAIYVAARDIVLKDRRSHDVFDAPAYGPGIKVPFLMVVNGLAPVFSTGLPTVPPPAYVNNIVLTGYTADTLKAYTPNTQSSMVAVVLQYHLTATLEQQT